MTIVLMVMNIIAGRLITRLGARRLMVVGLVLAAVGYLLLLPVSVGGSYWQLVVPMLMAASGIALMVPTMTNLTLSSVDPSRAGIASGVLNTARHASLTHRRSCSAVSRRCTLVLLPQPGALK